MVARPAPVHIDDLGAPRFPPEAAAMFEAMASMADGVRLEPEAVYEAAVEATGLDHFGDDGLHVEPMEVLCRALRTEAALSPPGRVQAFGQLVGHMRNRLRLEDLVRRNPEILDVPVDRPIVIAGLPRTGTTHLHNLLAADPGLRHLPYWESLEPVLDATEAEHVAGGAPDPRRARCEVGLQFVDTAMPLFVRMHEMTVDHAHEEIHLLAIAGSTMLFDTMALVPSWRAWYLATDQTPYYQYLRKVLQALTWLRGGRRWVLKSPQHMEQFGPLVTTFPDATVVVTHRDPVAITASTATMMAYTARTSAADVDVAGIGRYWAEGVEHFLRACVADHHLLPADRTLDVRFHEFMADDMATVERVYDVAGQPLPDESRAAMARYVATHPRGRHGTVDYRLGDFGLDPAERRAALRFYVERFGVEDEGLSR